MLTRRRLLIAASAAPVAVAGGYLLAQDGTIEAAPVFAEHGLAIRGADPVAYWRQGKPMAGSAAYRVDWRGAEWNFQNEENRAAFEADPERYAPAYGGFCAWAMARGDFAPIDPDAWAIQQGRLFLNYDDRIQQKWLADIPGFTERADGHWQTHMA